MDIKKSMMDKYLSDLADGIKTMQNYGTKDVILFHHNDSDGLTSGAILLRALKRSGYDVKRFSLEKPYPAVLEKLFAENSCRIIIFADFDGRIAPYISKLNRGKNLVLILDHHRAEKTDDPLVLNLDPDLYGLKGDRDISASVVCYKFAMQLDSRNRDLVHIAAFGGIADFYYLDRQVHSFNLECFEEASSAGLMRKAVEAGETHYYIRLGEREADVVDFYPLLDIVGGVGFYSGGPDLGIDLLLEGITDSNMAEIEKLKKIKEKIFSRELENLKNGGLITGENIQWFDTQERFKPMGVKMIGVFCEEIAEMDFIDKDKYIAGFQKIPDEIPGFGHIAMGQTKISMRSSEELSNRIIAGIMPGMDSFLPEAALNLGGFADACHSIAAAVTVDAGKERALIEETGRVLKRKMKINEQ